MTEPTQPDREPAAAPTPDAAPPPEAAPSPEATASPEAALSLDATASPVPTASPEGAPSPDPASADPANPEQVAAVETEAVETAPVAAATTPPAPSGRDPGAIIGSLVVAVLAFVLGVGALAVATGSLASPSPSPSPTPAPSVAPAGNAVGDPDAPVVIEVWADYQCPYCRLEDLLFGGALDREYVMPGIARIVYRDFAFLGQESTDAAIAARCAGAQEPAAQLRYHDALYTFQQGENQGRFVRANLLQIAEIAGVPDTTAFEACLDDPAVAAAVAEETTAGRNAGISSTPTLRLRGPGGERVLTGFSQTWPPLREAVEAVRVASTASPAPGGSATPAPPSTSAPTPSTSAPTPGSSAPTPGSSAPTPSTSAPTPGASAPTPGASASPSSSPSASASPSSSPSPTVTPAP